MTVEPLSIDQERLNSAVGKFLGDAGAALSGALVLIGDRLGLYKALAEQGPLSAEELARRTQTHERYVREWLANQAASGYVTYDAMISYRISKEISVQVNGYNLANKYYYANSYFSSPVENHVVPGAGRTGLLTVSFAY